MPRQPSAAAGIVSLTLLSNAPAMVQVAALDPTDRVLVIGSSSEPQTCVMKDEASLKSLFNKFFYLPLPDYASRQVMKGSTMPEV